MNRLESIKDMQSRAKTSHLYDGHYNDDLGYVLQRLERYETALKRIETTKELVQAHFLANDALKE